MNNNTIHPLQQYRTEVEPAIKSKLDEFELYGYDKVTEDELWEYLIKKRWKRHSEEKQLHQVVNDILRTNVSDYINYATIEAYKSPNMFSKEGKDAFKELF